MGGRLARLVASTWLSILLVYMGAVPTLALCVGDDHDGHLVVAMAPDHCNSDSTHTHDDDDHKDCFCPHEGCGPDDCIDLILTWAAEPPSREDSSVAPPTGALAVAGAEVSDASAGPVFDPGGPPGNPIPLAGQTCRLII